MEIWREKEKRRGGVMDAIGEEGEARRRQGMKEAKGDGERGEKEARKSKGWRLSLIHI